MSILLTKSRSYRRADILVRRKNTFLNILLDNRGFICRGVPSGLRPYTTPLLTIAPYL